jgi:hypothetical protein
MITWLIEKRRVALAATILLSLIGTGLFFRFAEITFDLPILVPFILFVTTLIYLFCFSWPFLGAATIEINRRLIGASWPKAEALGKFLLWFALLGVLVAVLGISTGDAEAALGVPGSCGLLAGACFYLGRLKLKSEQDDPSNGG